MEYPRTTPDASYPLETSLSWQFGVRRMRLQIEPCLEPGSERRKSPR